MRKPGPFSQLSFLEILPLAFAVITIKRIVSG